jgi:hypothetical protein
MKITGKEWNAFWDELDHDGCTWYHDDDDVPDSAESLSWFEVTHGTLFFQGSLVPDKHPLLNQRELNDQCADLLVVFRRWKKRQKVTTLVIEGDKNLVSEVLAALKSVGWKVAKS